ncbi:SPR6 (YER115C) [Zygosaccharomyces parabailii]|uniref:ZYBA0S08-03004g1_1 n=1 Tax=Zygosaccharomyces bailii (strain CLIB 213 / ATCC 58445 / CBS 680 / BCRC 21525 / NBRC 1098 / NCYC 1416 / NRRL Y-2227) TaxID=1333698 RepID=A0A8J2T9M5_ZYGB2|nr:SPR6 (YER115C) [Zygosaccharomyces parabailii]CDF90787.1 ZYBA0S08-03004g1_1 [Zygosaccharomyces bailii CLIB 213]CDH08970.1 uncharacterized protein ZBAI_00754 [Zygosaccharomyces bailii ISA1307]SJM85378.1 uncharacterized protein ZBIST_2225 [Zygosaccharomyces bailii]
MSGDIYSSLPCFLFDFEFFPNRNDLHYPIYLYWPSNHLVRGNASARHGYQSRRKNNCSTARKRTHVLHFQDKQRKCRRPTGLDPVYMSGCRLIRFGTFAGIRDTRSTRCPLRGLMHGIFIKPGKTCLCQSFTLCPSPLVRLANSDSLFKIRKSN